jgi:hypothetical protein
VVKGRFEHGMASLSPLEFTLFFFCCPWFCAIMIGGVYYLGVISFSITLSTVTNLYRT